MRVLAIALFAVAAHAAQASVVDRKRANRDLQGDIAADDKSYVPVVPRCGVPETPCCHAASGKDAPDLSAPCLDGTGCNSNIFAGPYEIGMCQVGCGGSYEPCCYSVTPSTNGGDDDVTCECAPGLSYNIAAKLCTPCGVAGTPPCSDTDCAAGQVRDEHKWLFFNFAVLQYTNQQLSGLLPVLLSIIFNDGSSWVRASVSETETPVDADQIDMDSMIENFSAASMFGGRPGPPGLALSGEPVCVPCGELGQLPCNSPVRQCSGELEVFNLIGYIEDNTNTGYMTGPPPPGSGIPTGLIPYPLPPQLYFLFLGLNICLPRYTCNGLGCLVEVGPTPCLVGEDCDRARPVRASNATAADPIPVPPEATESTLAPPEPTD
mmetsp:Transcript_10228/g.24123  ORF Transcript_10228/g.24123 Transcript_10228/m.24123 type:complete len:378 (+) Transcript_10228:79-1212(+)